MIGVLFIFVQQLHHPKLCCDYHELSVIVVVDLRTGSLYECQQGACGTLNSNAVSI